MKTLLTISQVIISLLLIGAILLQQRSGGLSQVFGGSSSMYRTRRGVERSVFIATIVLAILFVAAAALNVILR